MSRVFLIFTTHGLKHDFFSTTMTIMTPLSARDAVLLLHLLTAHAFVQLKYSHLDHDQSLQ